MMLYLIRWGEGEARIAQAHVVQVLVAQALARDIHRRIVLEIDAHVVVILVLCIISKEKKKITVVLKVGEVQGEEEEEEEEKEEEEEERDDTKDV